MQRPCIRLNLSISQLPSLLRQTLTREAFVASLVFPSFAFRYPQEHTECRKKTRSFWLASASSPVRASARRVCTPRHSLPGTQDKSTGTRINKLDLAKHRACTRHRHGVRPTCPGPTDAAHTIQIINIDTQPPRTLTRVAAIVVDEDGAHRHHTAIALFI